MMCMSRAGIRLFAVCAIFFTIVFTNCAAAQTKLDTEETQKLVLKPEIVPETCPMPLFPADVDTSSDVVGLVIALITVDSTGYINEVSIKNEIPKQRGYGDAVKTAVSKWRLKPAYWQGTPAIYTIAKTFRFERGEVTMQDNIKKRQPNNHPEVKIGQ